MRISALTAVLFSSFLLVDPARSAMLRALQTDAAADDSQKCPANQEYLKEVQYGCPASCDQPVPLCKAAIGPGCGCPDGTVLAGEARPRRSDWCIEAEKCTVDYELPAPQKCMKSGCNEEVCAAEKVDNTLCSAPTCKVSCMTKFGTCQQNADPNAKFPCDWDTSAAEKEYQVCLANCRNDGDY
jgi:hypothetical protein